jgi:hypothetical protein
VWQAAFFRRMQRIRGMRGAGPRGNRGKQQFQFLFGTSFQAGAMASAPFSSVFPDCRRRKAGSAQSFLFVSVKLYISFRIKKSSDAAFQGLTHSALALKGRFRLGLLCFLQRLTQTIMPPESQKHSHKCLSAAQPTCNPQYLLSGDNFHIKMFQTRFPY